MMSSLFGMLSGSEPGECGITSSQPPWEFFRLGLLDGSGRSLEAANQ